MPNWSLNYFNLLDYAFSVFKIDENNKADRKLITNKFRDLFIAFLSEPVIKGGNHKITFMSFLRHKVKNIPVVFKLGKYMKEYLRIYIFKLTHYQLLNKIIKIVF